MIDVINTLDPVFFGSVMKEYDTFQMEVAKEKNKVIELDPVMFDVLQKITDMFQSKTAKYAQPKFQLPPKKRKRPQFREVPELQAKINVQNDPFQ